jgi:hypothetical protein
MEAEKLLEIRAHIEYLLEHCDIPTELRDDFKGELAKIDQQLEQTIEYLETPG